MWVWEKMQIPDGPTLELLHYGLEITEKGIFVLFGGEIELSKGLNHKFRTFTAS
jgi:hypothetical protein